MITAWRKVSHWNFLQLTDLRFHKFLPTIQNSPIKETKQTTNNPTRKTQQENFSTARNEKKENFLRLENNFYRSLV